METTTMVSVAATYLACYLLALASAVVPWVNGEIMLLSLAALVRSWEIPGLVLCATAGQACGKLSIYATSRRAAQLARSAGRSREEASDAPGKWLDRLGARARHPFAWLFVSAVTGVPPLYLATIVAGAASLPCRRFVLTVTAGRLVHFTAVALMPELWRAGTQ